jgi:uncharacterized protein (DUF983 family)
MMAPADDVCPNCGMRGFSNPAQCPNCRAEIPKVRRGDLTPAGWVLIIIGAVVIGLVAGLSGLSALLDILIVVGLLAGIGAGVTMALRERRRRSPAKPK